MQQEAILHGARLNLHSFEPFDDGFRARILKADWKKTTPFEPFTVAQHDRETGLAASILIPPEPEFLLPTPLPTLGI